MDNECKYLKVEEEMDWMDIKDVKVYESIYDEMLRCKNIAFKMLSDYFYQLWY